MGKWADFFGVDSETVSARDEHDAGVAFKLRACAWEAGGQGDLTGEGYADAKADRIYPEAEKWWR